MPFKIIRKDITTMTVDAIVSCGNGGLRTEGGVSGQIITAAGAEMENVLRGLGGCAPGEAVVTPGFALPATYVIHTVGPIWAGGQNGEEHTLRLCYANTLKKAAELGCATVAFPVISSGRFGYPREEALCVAEAEILSFLSEHEDILVYLVIYDTPTCHLTNRMFCEIYNIFADVGAGEPCDRPWRGALLCDDVLHPPLARMEDTAELSPLLCAILSSREKPFREHLFFLIDQAGMTDPEVYRRANISRQVFSSIRNRADYRPSKGTALALAIALRLNLNQTLDLLRTFGATLSHSNEFDLIIEYFITTKNYNIFEINETLFDYDQPQLGG